MRAVIQRVSQASVVVDGKTTGEIETGFLVLVGVAQDDTEDDLKHIVKKTVGLRVFNDQGGKMNLAIKDVGGKVLAVSQFTLVGDTKKGNRPSFMNAAPPEMANRLYEEFIARVKEQGIEVQTGTFQADMKVSLVNDGPVTILIDSKNR